MIETLKDKDEWDVPKWKQPAKEITAAEIKFDKAEAELSEAKSAMSDAYTALHKAHAAYDKAYAALHEERAAVELPMIPRRLAP